MKSFPRSRVSLGLMAAVGACLGGPSIGADQAPVKAAPANATPAIPHAVYNDRKAPLEARVNDLLGRLTQPEKLSLLALDSHSDGLKLNLPAILRLGVPSVSTVDAPQGVRQGPSTVFPTGIIMASTWDPALIRRVGAVIGQEARAKNRQIIYGPCSNIQRTPQGGRDFENFSEDPDLAAQMAVSYIKGMQGEGVAACMKHFICNDQEHGRHDFNIQVDERALHEIYLPPFEAAVTQGHLWSLMSSLNQVNGQFAAQNKPLLQDMVKGQWGWDGLVIGDWGAVHDTAAALNGGTDVEMPEPRLYTPAAITAALTGKTVTQALIDDKVKRVLRLMVRTRMLDGPPPAPPATENTPTHQAVARQVAEEGITLLRNVRNLLPLDAHKIKSLAVIGPNASDTRLGGRWSADVPPYYKVSVLDGLKARAGSGVDVQFAQGCPRTGTGDAATLAAAVALAAKSDVAVVVVGTDNNYIGEELDPPDLYLPGDQDKLIAAVAAANKNTIVVLNNGMPLLMGRWLSQTPAVLEAWYSGQEAGNAVAAILFGDVSPSGRLPLTIANRRQDYSDWGTYPGKDQTVTYSEGVYVGYRHFDKQSVTPLYPFGFGLSYTTFAYSGLRAPATIRSGQPATVHVAVRNTGQRAGDEVVQLYVQPLSPKIDRPYQELKSFGRITLRPGQAGDVTLTLDPRAFAYWDVTHHRWQTDPGSYTLAVGSSSRDIRAQVTVKVE
jgi:beta-glucosidase